MTLQTLRNARDAWAVAAAVALLGAPAALADQPVDETRAADPDAKIMVESLSGEVRIVGWDRGELHISGTIGDDVEELEIRGEGGRIEIDVRLPDGRSSGRKDYDVDLEISVPRRSEVYLESVSTAHEVDGFDGQVHIESVSGGASVEGGSAEVKVESVSGGIDVRGASGLVRAESVSGSIEIHGSADDVSATTVSGSVEVNAGVVEACELGSVSGPIHFTGGLARGARFEVEGHSGTVDLAFSSDVSASFSVETFSGGIDNRLTADEAQRTSRYAPGKALDFTVGSGDATVDVENFSGTVILRRE